MLVTTDYSSVVMSSETELIASIVTQCPRVSDSVQARAELPMKVLMPAL